MKLHLLLTNDIAKTKPESCNIINDYGYLKVKLNDGGEAFGLHCVVEDTTENIADWLRPFDGFLVGDGNPQLEQFEIHHVK